MTTNKEYIGDGVYVSFDGYQLWLETEREFGQKHYIALEPEVFKALCDYRNRVIAQSVKVALEEIIDND